MTTPLDSGILALFPTNPAVLRSRNTAPPPAPHPANKFPGLHRTRRLQTLTLTLPSAAAAMVSEAADAGIDRVMWTEAEIAARVAEVASELAADLRRLPEPAVVVGVATGAFLFLADLVRRVDAPLAVDLVRAESYGGGTESSGRPRVTSDLKVDVAGKHVVVVEDIVDTGNTVSCLIAHLQKKGASSISVCTFLDKPARRKVNFQLLGDGKFYRGFEGLALCMHKRLEGPTVFEMLEKALQLAISEERVPEERNIKLLIAQMHVVKGDLDVASEKLQNLINEDPQDFQPHLCQGIVYALLDKKEEADEQFDTYRSLVPDELPDKSFINDVILSAKIESKDRLRRGLRIRVPI